MSKNGIFTVSLDFELMWGLQDGHSIDDYGANIKGGINAIPRLLEYFDKYNIHVTWGAVGGIMAQNVDEFVTFAPGERFRPSYDNPNLSPYRLLNDLQNEKVAEYYFAKNLFSKISSYKNMEIGSHTFSHYYCNESGQTEEQFILDMRSTKAIMNNNGYNPVSVIFPRNQINKNFVQKLNDLGFSCYRGREEDWIHRISNTKLMKIIRMFDVYFPISGSGAYSLKDRYPNNQVYNFCGSRFLRPYNPKLAFLEKLKIRRIKGQMKYAAKKGLVYHLWWHPHNFGKNQDENFKNLDEILQYYSYLNEKYDMISLNMGELTEILKKEK